MGQILIFINIDKDAYDRVEIRDNSNTKLNANWQSNKDDTITLMWNGLDWVELAHFNN